MTAGDEKRGRPFQNVGFPMSAMTAMTRDYGDFAPRVALVWPENNVKLLSICIVRLW
jgi:hypothetical protein